MSTSPQIFDDVPTLDSSDDARKALIETPRSPEYQKSYFTFVWTRRNNDRDDIKSSGLLAIPSALESNGGWYSTPLPILPMIVLSITMLGEFLSANVSTPFLLFMVKRFDELAEEADVAFWTGILVASFFLAQFLTSLLWSTMAANYGQRSALFTSLLGSAVTCLAFGASTSLRQAITIRLFQGIFAGAIGVARGCVTTITDSSNEGRAYAILGFCWGFGGMAGAIIGGAFESPASKWPGIFGKSSIMADYPYLLPCAIAASVMFAGSILSLFLARDTGPRGVSIHLASEECLTAHLEHNILDGLIEEPNCENVINPLRRKVSKRLSGSFVQHIPEANSELPSGTAPLSVPLARTFSMASRTDGSTYGRSGSYRRQLATPTMLGIRRSSIASSMYWRESEIDGQPLTADTGDFNFAQRLLMANENTVTNITDFWVAAALNNDTEDPFRSDSEGGSIADQSEFANETGDENTSPVLVRLGKQPSSVPSHLRSPLHKRSSNISSLRLGKSSCRQSISPQDTPIRDIPSLCTERPSAGRLPYTVPVVSTTTSDAHKILSGPNEPTDMLATIIENQRASSLQETLTTAAVDSAKSASLASQLPLHIIIQYGLLALHSTMHDQVFMSYLVSEYRYGGLSLNAGHFAQLLGLMCIAQLVFQFCLYPNFGPPRGRLSHLTMFRLGTLLFVPAYISVTLYRVFASPTGDRNFLLMMTLAVSTAIRYCGNTFAFTAIAILLNYMTPPHAIGFANGVAQSIAGLLRCVGPVIGGYVWATSTQNNPSGYPVGFLVCGGVAVVAIAHSVLIQ